MNFDEKPKQPESPKQNEPKKEVFFCPNCGNEMIRYKSCFKCQICGFSECEMPIG